jgi:molybdate transport system ATP-binding protein
MVEWSVVVNADRGTRPDDDAPADLHARIVVQRPGFDLDVQLEIPAGTTAALLGPNGAGKSTIVGVIAGLADDALAEAVIRVGERVLDDSSAGHRTPVEARRVGVVFQDHLLFEHLDVLDNIAFGPMSQGRTRRRARAIASEWIATLGLSHLAQRRPSELSGGQAQRVAIARTLAADPEVVLFDEPLAALDVASRTELRRVLRRHLDDFAGPRLLITHDPTDAFVLADTVMVIENGRVSQVGTPDEIRRHPRTPYVAALAGTNLFTGCADGGAVRLDDHDVTLTVADTTLAGPVLTTVSPNAISLHAVRPEGSQRNVWKSQVELIEPLGDIVRITLGAPLPVSIDVTPGAVDALGLVPGRDAWAAIKATEIHISPV